MNANDQQLVNALRGPVIMITIGVLFLLDNLTSLQIALAGGSRRRSIPPGPVNTSFPGSFPPEGFDNPEPRPTGEYRR